MITHSIDNQRRMFAIQLAGSIGAEHVEVAAFLH
jgi:hypothetical protein